ncbi:predicted protein [Methanosarcina acetivorans C2A]|uniref:Uncharacterized protein n=1 Tax=Methanosarcina acetivorans (strain ATCC 35395 / DSM 2834 / JCM 12185 / C2A) TaxID=188937 RepID=Q8TTE8_METAC|nr:predicted protein [Methanosarcina acetivorans C2A]
MFSIYTEKQELPLFRFESMDRRQSFMNKMEFSGVPLKKDYHSPLFHKKVIIHRSFLKNKIVVEVVTELDQ